MRSNKQIVDSRSFEKHCCVHVKIQHDSRVESKHTLSKSFANIQN